MTKTDDKYSTMRLSSSYNEALSCTQRSNGAQGSEARRTEAKSKGGFTGTSWCLRAVHPCLTHVIPMSSMVCYGLGCLLPSCPLLKWVGSLKQIEMIHSIRMLSAGDSKFTSHGTRTRTVALRRKDGRAFGATPLTVRVPRTET